MFDVHNIRTRDYYFVVDDQHNPCTDTANRDRAIAVADRLAYSGTTFYVFDHTGIVHTATAKIGA